MLLSSAALLTNCETFCTSSGGAGGGGGGGGGGAAVGIAGGAGSPTPMSGAESLWVIHCLASSAQSTIEEIQK